MALRATEDPNEIAHVGVDDVVSGAIRARSLTETKIARIRAITGRLRILALNAMIEATQAGDHGRGFAVVAQEVRNISQEVEQISGSFASELVSEIAALETLTRRMAEDAQGARLVDLALNAVELIDRNLYERSCDVRWWATDPSLVDALQNAGEGPSAFASQRLGVILDAYTVYLDLWLCDMSGRVVVNGRPDRYRATGLDVRGRSWFQRARVLASGNDYAVSEVDVEPGVGHAQVATYSATVREGGRADGRILGVLAIHFDWEPQARAIVGGVRLGETERDKTRVLLVDRTHRVIAASDRVGILSEHFPLQAEGRLSGSYRQEGAVVAFHHTPGYETYQGLGWYGVIVQRDA